MVLLVQQRRSAPLRPRIRVVTRWAMAAKLMEVAKEGKKGDSQRTASEAQPSSICYQEKKDEEADHGCG
jgi:hypothetical protein